MRNESKKNLATSRLIVIANYIAEARGQVERGHDGEYERGLLQIALQEWLPEIESLIPDWQAQLGRLTAQA